MAAQKTGQLGHRAAVGHRQVRTSCCPRYRQVVVPCLDDVPCPDKWFSHVCKSSCPMHAWTMSYCLRFRQVVVPCLNDVAGPDKCLSHVCSCSMSVAVPCQDKWLSIVQGPDKWLSKETYHTQPALIPIQWDKG